MANWHNTETPAYVIGVPDPEQKPEDLPDYPNIRCGWCRGEWGLFDPHPEQWIPGTVTDSDDLPDRGLPVLYRCASCGAPTMLAFEIVAEPANGNRAKLTGKYSVAPAEGAPRFPHRELKGTVAEQYRDEAWACYKSGHYRGAIVLARSCLQVAGRRYLTKKEFGFFQKELTELSKHLGIGIKSVLEGTKTFGDSRAHPDPARETAPERTEAAEALDRMDIVLTVFSALERYGILKVKHGRRRSAKVKTIAKAAASAKGP